MNDVLDAILQAVQGVDPVLRTLLSGLAMFFETSILVGLVVPGDTIVIVSATGVGNPVEYWGLLVAVIVGSLAGESVGFLIGRHFGPRLRTSRLGRRIGARNWDRAERYLDRRGGPAVFISRFLPVLHAIIPLTVGLSSMSYRRFLAWTAPACTIWAFAYISAAAAAAESYRALADRLHYAGYLFVGAIVLFFLVAALVRWILHRVERRHMRASDEAPVGQTPEERESREGFSADQ